MLAYPANNSTNIDLFLKEKANTAKETIGQADKALGSTDDFSKSFFFIGIQMLKGTSCSMKRFLEGSEIKFSSFGYIL